MRRILLFQLLLLALLSLPARAQSDPQLLARWDGPGAATIQWTQAQRGCLSVEHATGEQAFIGCYERAPATIIVELGHVGPLSGDLRPTAGDTYVLTSQGQTWRAPLLARALYFPVFRA